MDPEDKEWLLAVLPSYPGEFDTLGGYKKSGDAVCLNFRGFCPIHMKTHRSNHWYLVRNGDARYIRCHKDHSVTGPSISGKNLSKNPVRAQARAKAAEFVWNNDSPLHRNLCTQEVYERTPSGWVVHAPDSEVATGFDNKSTFAGVWPALLDSPPVVPITRSGYLLLLKKKN